MPILVAILVVLLVVFVVLPLLGVALWLVISTAVVGLVLGALGRLVVPGRQSFGLLATMAIGIGGSFVGSLVGRIFGAGGLVTLLLQIAVAAGGVLLVEGGSRGRLPGGRRSLPR